MKLVSPAELLDVSWLMFSEESDKETSEDRYDRDVEGETVGAREYSRKYGWDKASLAVILFLGSN